MPNIFHQFCAHFVSGPRDKWRLNAQHSWCFHYILACVIQTLRYFPDYQIQCSKTVPARYVWQHQLWYGSPSTWLSFSSAPISSRSTRSVFRQPRFENLAAANFILVKLAFLKCPSLNSFVTV